MSESESRSRVLVVDDTPENVDVLAGVLKADYQVSVALNGEKALKLAQGEKPPDIILLDVMMPEMDGYEVCRRLKADDATNDIPVVFVTAKTEVEDETKGFELGAVDYIIKPISPAVVQARVKTQLALKESRQKLEQLSVKLSRYLSPQVYQSIFEGKQDAQIGSSRKKLTVFLSDIVGFTAQTEHMEAEDLTFLLNSYLNRMANIVMLHGGTLDKYIGDAILVFFGDPESKGTEEDAAACVAMALDMRRAIDELQKLWEKRGITQQFTIRIGITTGYCTVGNFGSEQRMDYTVIGGHVNLASRLESAATPGEILIGPETYALVNSRFACDPKEPISVKGIEGPVQTYQVVGEASGGAADGKIEASRPGFFLQVDPAAIDPDEKRAVVDALRSAISRLQ